MHRNEPTNLPPLSPIPIDIDSTTTTTPLHLQHAANNDNYHTPSFQVATNSQASDMPSAALVASPVTHQARSVNHQQHPFLWMQQQTIPQQQQQQHASMAPTHSSPPFISLVPPSSSTPATLSPLLLQYPPSTSMALPVQLQPKNNSLISDQQLQQQHAIFLQQPSSTSFAAATQPLPGFVSPMPSFFVPGNMRTMLNATPIPNHHQHINVTTPNNQLQKNVFPGNTYPYQQDFHDEVTIQPSSKAFNDLLADFESRMTSQRWFLPPVSNSTSAPSPLPVMVVAPTPVPPHTPQTLPSIPATPKTNSSVIVYPPATVPSVVTLLPPPLPPKSALVNRKRRVAATTTRRKSSTGSDDASLASTHANSTTVATTTTSPLFPFVHTKEENEETVTPKRIGIYTIEERRARIEKYRNKRRIFVKKVRYQCRKEFADSRKRVRGRFAKVHEQEEEPASSEESSPDSA